MKEKDKDIGYLKFESDDKYHELYTLRILTATKENPIKNIKKENIIKNSQKKNLIKNLKNLSYVGGEESWKIYIEKLLKEKNISTAVMEVLQLYKDKELLFGDLLKLKASGLKYFFGELKTKIKKSENNCCKDIQFLETILKETKNETERKILQNIIYYLCKMKKKYISNILESCDEIGKKFTQESIVFLESIEGKIFLAEKKIFCAEELCILYAHSINFAQTNNDALKCLFLTCTYFLKIPTTEIHIDKSKIIIELLYESIKKICNKLKSCSILLLHGGFYNTWKNKTKIFLEMDEKNITFEEIHEVINLSRSLVTKCIFEKKNDDAINKRKWGGEFSLFANRSSKVEKTDKGNNNTQQKFRRYSL
jgi:hypothetical protein